jgi:hypothetical protein
MSYTNHPAYDGGNPIATMTDTKEPTPDAITEITGVVAVTDDDIITELLRSVRDKIRATLEIRGNDFGGKQAYISFTPQEYALIEGAL